MMWPDYRSYLVLLWEVAAVVFVVGIAMVWPPRRRRVISVGWNLPRWIGGHPKLSVVTTGTVGFLIAASFCLVRVPAPREFDDFCYLLSADTFAQGRLTNPTHSHWEHFESVFLFHQPSYQSKYPPAQAMVLAIGQSVAGHPIVGVWLTTGLACGAICWMLQAWLPGHWAFLGALWPVLRLGILLDFHMLWSRSYWGGMLAAAGGALVYGGLRRIVNSARPIDALLIGSGLAVLANTRPLEGLVISMPAAAVLLGWILRQQEFGIRQLVNRVVMPIVAVILLTAVWMGYYNYRVTGNALVLPYSHHQELYNPVPNFVGCAPAPAKEYRHRDIERFYEGKLQESPYALTRSWTGWARESVQKLKHAWLFFLGPALTLPLFRLRTVLRRDRWIQLAFVATVANLIVYLLIVWPPFVYLSPATGLIIYVVIECTRSLSSFRIDGRPAGRFIQKSLIVICFVSFILGFAELMLWCSLAPQGFAEKRQAMIDSLIRSGGTHLIMVRFSPDNTAERQWVYNLANIDDQAVVWAREMDDERNRRLWRYYPKRKKWLFEANRKPWKLVPHPLP